MNEAKFKVKDVVCLAGLVNETRGVVTSIYESKQYPSGWQVIFEDDFGKCYAYCQDRLELIYRKEENGHTL